MLVCRRRRHVMDLHRRQRHRLWQLVLLLVTLLALLLLGGGRGRERLQLLLVLGRQRREARPLLFPLFHLVLLVRLHVSRQVQTECARRASSEQVFEGEFRGSLSHSKS